MPTAKELVEEAKKRAKEEESFPLPFLDTEILFRKPADATEYHRLKRNVESEVKKVKVLTPLPFKPYKELPAEIIGQAYWVHKMAVDPPFSFLEALELSEAGASLTYLHQSLMQKIGESVIMDERQEIDEAKNE